MCYGSTGLGRVCGFAGDRGCRERRLVLQRTSSLGLPISARSMRRDHARNSLPFIRQPQHGSMGSKAGRAAAIAREFRS